MSSLNSFHYRNLRTVSQLEIEHDEIEKEMDLAPVHCRNAYSEGRTFYPLCSGSSASVNIFVKSSCLESLYSAYARATIARR